MIIIKTNNGDRFVNDAETLMVIHDKETARVTVHLKSWRNKQPAPFHILNVEAVVYVNDAQPTNWLDEGSAVEGLKKKLNDVDRWSKSMEKQLKAVKDDLLHFAHDMAEIVNNYHDKLPYDVKKQIEYQAVDLKTKVLTDSYSRL